MQTVRFLLPLLTAGAMAARLPAAEPPRYAEAVATPILPETTSEESGYFSLHEADDGTIGVGTARYGHNAYLVEFDPRSGTRRIVLDTHRTCGLSATGYAAHAKLHARNAVGPSGRVYAGSKQGYPRDGDQQTYPGGRAMVCDARTGRTENLGMPFPGQGVIDVMPDEACDRLDMGYAHGDACVRIPGYPIPILPPSGVLQVAACESISTEAVARIGAAR